jgi:hypothetical protein
MLSYKRHYEYVWNEIDVPWVSGPTAPVSGSDVIVDIGIIPS